MIGLTLQNAGDQVWTAAGQALGQAASVAAQQALLGIVSNAVQYAVPTTGQTVTSDGSPMLLIDPAGTLVALTVTLPASPVDKQRWAMATSQAITTLTISGGTIVGTLTTMPLAGYADFIYNTTSAKWFRVG